MPLIRDFVTILFGWNGNCKTLSIILVQTGFAGGFRQWSINGRTRQRCQVLAETRVTAITSCSLLSTLPWLFHLRCGAERDTMSTTPPVDPIHSADGSELDVRQVSPAIVSRPVHRNKKRKPGTSLTKIVVLVVIFATLTATLFFLLRGVNERASRETAALAQSHVAAANSEPEGRR